MAIYSVRGFGAGAMCFTGVPPCHQSVKLHMKLPTFLISISWFSKKKLWEIHLLLYLIYLFISIQHFWLPLFGFQVEFSGRFCPAFAPLLPRFCPAFAPLLPRSSVDMKLPNDQLVPIANWFPSSFSNQFSNWQVAFRRPSSTAACSIWLVHSNPQHLDCFGLFPSLKTSWIASWLQSRTTAAATNCKSNDG